MNILETITLYWNEFGIIYDTVLKYGAWKAVSVLAPSLFVFGIVRSAYLYAKGNEIGRLRDSMFALRLGDKLLTLVGLQNHTTFRDQVGWDDDRNHRIYETTPIGSSLVGMVLDVGACTLITLVSFLIWPLVAFLGVTIGPLHICRVHNIRKKTFIANLKGEKADA